jgi:hypothetical protein
MQSEITPEDLDVRNYDTQDIREDLAGMLEVFGPNDPTVKEYQAELRRRGLGTYTRKIKANQHTITYPDGTERISFGYHGITNWFDVAEPNWNRNGPYPNRPRMEQQYGNIFILVR